MEKKSKASESQKGMTLIELLVAIAVSGLLLSAVTYLFITHNKVYTVQDQVLRIQQNIRGAMSTMARDIRMAGLDPTGEADCAGFDEENSSDIEMHISYDYNSNGTCDQVSYYTYDESKSELKLEKHEGQGAQPFVEDVSDLEFQPLDDAGNPVNFTDSTQVEIRVCGQISGAYAEEFDSEHCFEKRVRRRN